MDSKVVDRTLREQFWSRLKEQGFTSRSGRTAWRDRTTSVYTINVQSFNSYLATVLHTTTFSFSIRASVFYPAIARRSTMGRFVKDWQRPQEPHCQARSTIEKGIEQAGLGGDQAWRDRPDIWFVLADASNLAEVVADAAERTLADGLPWLDELADLGEATRRFLEVPNRFWGRGVMIEDFGGTLGSPKRLHSAGALAAERGDVSLLGDVVTAMAEEPYWVDHPADLERLQEELARLRSAG